ncbi:hypothetical protein ACFE04_015690 [Oxalis oulophora]
MGASSCIQLMVIEDHSFFKNRISQFPEIQSIPMFGITNFVTMKNTRTRAKVKSTTEVLKAADDRKLGKRKAPEKSSKPPKAAKGKKAAKDPNRPKRPPSAFFVFLEEFRVQFRKDNPNLNAVSAVAKAGGTKWKSMSKEDKAPYEAKAAKKKTEYEKVMNSYNKKQDDEEEKSKSEVSEEDHEASGEEQHDDEDEDEDDDDE